MLPFPTIIFANERISGGQCTTDQNTGFGSNIIKQIANGNFFFGILKDQSKGRQKVIKKEHIGM